MINAFAVVNHTLKHGGGSFAIDGRPAPAHGYMVGGAAPSAVIPATTFGAQSVIDYILEHEDVLTKDDSTYLGTWQHEGSVHLDVSDWVKFRVTAEWMSQLRNELAYWDVAKSEEVKI